MSANLNNFGNTPEKSATKNFLSLANSHINELLSKGGEIVATPEISCKPQQTAELSAVEKFRKSILDQNREYPPPAPVINLWQNGKTIPFLTKKSFSLWQGKQKSKKTTVLALAVAAFIYNYAKNDLTYFTAAAEGTVLFFDTEQGESYASRTMKLILSLAGLKTSTKLVYCDLRGYSPKERMEIIRAGIENTPNVQLVIVDGVVDLMNDFMDANEGQITIDKLVKLSSDFDIHIAGVLHQNKADKNARAHVGTFASQKCEIEISTEVDPADRNQSIVTCLNSRGLPFESFAIRWDIDSLPCIVQEWKSATGSQEKTSKCYGASKEAAEAIFQPMAALSHAVAIREIMNVLLKSESTAKRTLNNYLGWGFIVKGGDGLYRINTDKGSRVHEGSKTGS